MNLYANIFTNFQAAINAFLNNAISRTISAFLPVVTTCLGIYFILYAWAGIRGQVQDWGNDSVYRMLRIVAILGVGFTVSGYGTYVLNPILGLPTDLTSVVTGQSADSVAGPAILDQQLSVAWNLGSDAFSKGSVFSENGIVFYFTGAIFYLAGTIMTVYAAYLILLSQGMLALLLGFGPIFVGCLIFDVSKRFFDAWLGLLINYVALQVLAVTTVSFTFVTFQHYLAQMNTDSGLGAALGLLVVAIICILMILGVTHVASSLGGGSPVHTGFGNTALAMATGGGWRAATAPFKAGGRAAGRAAGTKMRSMAKAATNRFRMNSVRSG